MAQISSLEMQETHPETLKQVVSNQPIKEDGLEQENFSLLQNKTQNAEEANEKCCAFCQSGTLFCLICECCVNCLSCTVQILACCAAISN